MKIIGRPEAVSKARETLLNDLDTKSNRVTLKINVAYGEHSHVIGKEGANIKKGLNRLERTKTTNLNTCARTCMLNNPISDL